MIKKWLALILACLLLLPLAAGCGREDREDTVKVVCTVFPLYEWARNIVGDTEGVEVVWLVKNGADLHSYQPTTADVVEMISCDLLLYVGGDSETWVEACLKNRDDGDRVMLDLREAEGVVLRKTSAESILEEDASHGHGHDHDHDHGAHATDEHIWLSLDNAEACSLAITEALCDIDGENAQAYRANADTYVAQLEALDEAYRTTVAKASEPRLLFADRFPFVYLAEAYGIRYVAAFEGCSTESEVTPDTLIHLAEHVDEWGLEWILTTEASDGTLARGVIGATKEKNQRIAVLHSMQSVEAREAERGATYLGIMERNLEVLQGVLAE
jgi:zinc transport system substrate-binding protein